MIHKRTMNKNGNIDVLHSGKFPTGSNRYRSKDSTSSFLFFVSTNAFSLSSTILHSPSSSLCPNQSQTTINPYTQYRKKFVPVYAERRLQEQDDDNDDGTLEEENEPQYKSKLYAKMIKDVKGRNNITPAITTTKNQGKGYPRSKVVSQSKENAGNKNIPKPTTKSKMKDTTREKSNLSPPIQLQKQTSKSEVVKNTKQIFTNNNNNSEKEEKDSFREVSYSNEDEEIDQFLFGSDYNSDPFLFWGNQTDTNNVQSSSSFTNEVSPNDTPGDILDRALRSLRNLDHPTPNHGATVFLKYCLPISKSDQWGAMSGTATKNNENEWTEIIRGSFTSAMLVGRLLTSPNFSILLEWDRLDVTEGYSVESSSISSSFGSTVAFVSAAMFVTSSNNNYNNNYDEQEVDKNIPSNSFNTNQPVMVQFTLRKQLGGIWLIDKAAVINKREWFAL